MNTATASHITAADGGGRAGWRYVAGLVLITAAWLYGGSAVFSWMLHLPLGGVTAFVALNSSMLALLAATVLVTRVLHGRGWLSLVTPRAGIDRRRLVQGAALWAVLLLFFAAVESLLYPGRYAWTLDLAHWLPFAAAVLLMTPLQCLAEELAFRGYLMQALGRLWAQPLFIAVASAAVFTLPHLMNPEVEIYGTGIMAANYFAMGLFFAWIALRDGRLELAIGAHVANNLLLALCVNYAGSVLDTPSLFTADRLDPVYSLVTLVIGAAAFTALAFRRSRADG